MVHATVLVLKKNSKKKKSMSEKHLCQGDIPSADWKQVYAVNFGLFTSVTNSWIILKLISGTLTLHDDVAKFLVADITTKMPINSSP